MSFKTVSRDFSISTSVNAISRFACASWRIFIWKQDKSVFRFFTESWGKSSLGARLRTRKVRGRDASLPAPLLAASLELVGRETVGALPQTPQGTLSLDPARGNCPLTPFRDWIGRAFMLLPRAAFGASPKPLFVSPTFREEPFFVMLCAQSGFSAPAAGNTIHADSRSRRASRRCRRSSAR